MNNLFWVPLYLNSMTTAKTPMWHHLATIFKLWHTQMKTSGPPQWCNSWLAAKDSMHMQNPCRSPGTCHCFFTKKSQNSACTQRTQLHMWPVRLHARVYLVVLHAQCQRVTRCTTARSQHEVPLGYATVTDQPEASNESSTWRLLHLVACTHVLPSPRQCTNGAVKSPALAFGNHSNTAAKPLQAAWQSHPATPPCA